MFDFVLLRLRKLGIFAVRSLFCFCSILFSNLLWPVRLSLSYNGDNLEAPNVINILFLITYTIGTYRVESEYEFKTLAFKEL